MCGYDVVRIAREQELEAGVFARLVADGEHARAGVLLDHSPTPHTLVLARRRDAADQAACVFLLELAGAARCGIYEQRPFVCSTYPTELHNGAVRVREDVICPPTAWNVAGLDLPSWRARLLRMELEWRVYERVVARFNASEERDEASFFAWILEAYGRIEPIREQLGKRGLAAAAQSIATVSKDEPAGVGERFLADVVAAL